MISGNGHEELNAHLLDHNPFYADDDAGAAKMHSQSSGRSLGIGPTVARLARGNPLIIGAFVLAGLVIGLLYLALSTPRFTASMVVGPAENSKSDLTSMLGSSSLASLARGAAGLSSEVSPFSKFQQEIYSNDVAKVLIADPAIAHGIFWKKWDAKAQKWREPGALMQAGRWLLSMQAWRPPNSEDLKEYIQDYVKLSEVESSGLFRITYTGTPREFSVYFLHALWRASDNILRQQELKLSTTYIKFLTERLQTETNAEMRQSLIALLTAQERTLMISSASNVPFSASVIENPHAPERPASPILLFGLVGFPLLFGLIGIGLLYLRERLLGR